MPIISLVFILPVWGLIETVELYPRRYIPQKTFPLRKIPALQKQRRYFSAANTCSVESKTFKAGEKFTLARTGPCVTYICRRSGGYTVINQGAHCGDGDSCWPLNTIRTRACTVEMCVQGKDGHVKFVTVQEGCDFRNKCHRVGSTWYHSCHFYICKKQVIQLGAVFKVQLLGGRCRDVEGQCHDPGDFFAHVIGGKLYDYCYCTFSDGRFRYNCLP